MREYMSDDGNIIDRNYGLSKVALAFKLDLIRAMGVHLSRHTKLTTKRLLDPSAIDALLAELGAVGERNSLMLPRRVVGCRGNSMIILSDSDGSLVPISNEPIRVVLEGIGGLIDNYSGVYINLNEKRLNAQFNFAAPVKHGDFKIAYAIMVDIHYGARNALVTNWIRIENREVHKDISRVIDRLRINGLSWSQRPRTASQLADVLFKSLNTYATNIHSGKFKTILIGS